MEQLDKILESCHQIRNKVQEKLKWEVNPFLIRIQSVILELETHFTAVFSTKNVNELKYHWSVLYRAGDTLDEMATMLRNTTPVLIQTEVDYIKKELVLFT